VHPTSAVYIAPTPLNKIMLSAGFANEESSHGPAAAEQKSPRPSGLWMDGGAVAFAIALTAALHYLSAAMHPVWFGIVEHLYSVPVIWAALRGGVKAGTLAGLASAVAVIFVLVNRDLSAEIKSMMFTETLAFVIVGVAGGLVASKWRGRLLQVAALKADLRDRTDQLTRSGKLSATGELAIGLAHELRHPVASLKGIVSILRSPDASADVREECVTILGRECERMERLLAELLAFARPRQPEVAPAHVEEIVDAAFSLVRYVAGAAHVGFEKEIADDVRNLHCDRELIKQVLVNLLLNSVHAMPNGGTVRVRVVAQRNAAVLEVIDEGHGVAPELMDKIFLPFVTTRSEGTGLGLSIARQIVAQHGGELTAEKNGRCGMTFRFDLPLHQMSPQ
jgi:two-component system, NtrC family, sensor histidine kinase HydH